MDEIDYCRFRRNDYFCGKIKKVARAVGGLAKFHYFCNRHTTRKRFLRSALVNLDNSQ